MINLTVTAGIKSEEVVCNARPQSFHTRKQAFHTSVLGENKGIHLSSEA